MELSVIANSAQTTVNMAARAGLGSREIKFCLPRKDKVSFSRRNSNVCLVGQNSKWGDQKPLLRFTLKAVHSQTVPCRRPSAATGKSLDGVRLFVGLPLDAASDCNTVNHEKAIAVGLRALKLLGVEGVELPVWWGVVEKEAMRKYGWSSYLAVADMVQKAGLKLHVSLCFHASKQLKISLPDWVSKIGESQPNIFYTDRSGQRCKECLSLAVDELPVLDGKTAIQVYQEFCESFKSAFMPFMGSTITAISMGLGPDGELRYPSHCMQNRKSKILGVGEFQCYDENMLRLLKQHAEAAGNPLWGLGGPHDAPSYDQTPNSNNFFKDHGGSWESDYGNFFLSWYSRQLIAHGNRLLSLASSTFSHTGVTIHGKVPLMHTWYKTRSHPAELTAGFYNSDNRDGYEAVAEMFAKNSCKMILPGMDLTDEHQHPDSRSSPESLLDQIRAACGRHGVEVSGQNSSVSGVPAGFDQMKKNLSGEDMVDLFIYKRMGVHFFSPEHFPSFTQFVRNCNQPELDSDDLPEQAEVRQSSHRNSDASIHVQAA